MNGVKSLEKNSSQEPAYQPSVDILKHPKSESSFIEISHWKCVDQFLKRTPAAQSWSKARTWQDK